MSFTFLHLKRKIRKNEYFCVDIANRAVTSSCGYESKENDYAVTKVSLHFASRDILNSCLDIIKQTKKNNQFVSSLWHRVYFDVDFVFLTS